MGVGQDHILNKGFLATGATAYAVGDVVEQIAGTGSMSGVLNSVRRCTTANSLVELAVCMEPLDTTRLGFGKAYINCALLGIARVKVGAGGVTAGDRVKTDAAAGIVTAARAAAGVQPQPILGIAQETGAQGALVDVLLTPGGTF